MSRGYVVGSLRPPWSGSVESNNSQWTGGEVKVKPKRARPRVTFVCQKQEEVWRSNGRRWTGCCQVLKEFRRAVAL